MGFLYDGLVSVSKSAWMKDRSVCIAIVRTMAHVEDSGSRTMLRMDIGFLVVSWSHAEDACPLASPEILKVAYIGFNHDS